MENLLELRNEIDAIDKEIVGLFQKRMKISSEVAEYKISTGKKVFDRAREEEKIRAVTELADNDFNRHGIEELFQQIMSMSRKLQYQLLAQNGVVGRLPFIAVEEIEKSRVRVVFQGVEGAYSEAAMKAFFQDDITSCHVEHWRDASGGDRRGFRGLPSRSFRSKDATAGSVSDMYDLLMEFENYIVGEQVIRCQHNLLGLPDAELSDIKTVYSHSQALSQCKEYLGTHRDWKQIPMVNTAMAAKKVKEDGDKTQAAIASAYAGEKFGLKVLADKIYDNEANSTRFIIVTNQRIFRWDAKKISISFEVPHTSGSLYNILSHFIYNNLNMTKIESRPIPGRNWEYRFFIDFEGNLNDGGVKNALRGIREEANNMRILGNY